MARLRPEQRQLAHDHRPAHVTTAARLRQQFQQPRPAIDPVDDLVRDLADYDKAFGLDAREVS